MEDWVIDGIDFNNLEAERYWTFPKSYKGDAKEETRNMIFSGNYIGARKMDGAYYRFIKDMNGKMRLQGRSKSVHGDYLDKLDHVPQLMDFFNWLPNGTCLIGEIYFPENEGSSNVTKIMGCLTDKAIYRQEHGDKLWYYVFDIYAYAGHSLLASSIEGRVARICELEKFWLHINDEQHKYINFAHYLEGKTLWNHLQWVLANGGEGVVITKKGTIPSPGKRTARKTLKVKKELQENIDCVIIGSNPPTKNYTGKEIKTWNYYANIITDEKLSEGIHFKEYQEGQPIEPVTKSWYNNIPGSLRLGLYDEKNKKVVYYGDLSGLTQEILINWKDYVGKVCEVSAMQFTDDRKMRHPRFVRWREDKNAEDCSMKQIE